MTELTLHRTFNNATLYIVFVQRTSFEEMNCSVAQCLEVVGEWWSLLIVRDAFLGVTRRSAPRRLRPDRSKRRNSVRYHFVASKAYRAS